MVIKILLGFYILGIVVFWLGMIDCFVYWGRNYYDKNDESRENTFISQMILLIVIILTSFIPIINFWVGAKLSLEKDDLWEKHYKEHS